MADSPNGVTQPTDWRGFLTDDLKADPVVSGWSEKASEKDVPSVIKSLAHAHHRLGNAIHLPGKDAKPEEIDGLKNKLYDAGLFKRPPKAEDYKIAKPENLPDGIGWNEDLVKKFATTLHKHGVPTEAVPELLALQQEALGGIAATLKIDRDEAMATLKREYGDQFEARREMVKRMNNVVFSEESAKFLGETGLGDDPRFLSFLMRMAPLAMQDSSFMESLPQAQGGTIQPSQASDELAKIMTDKEHPKYKGYWAGDPAVKQYVDDLFKRAHPGAAVSP